MIESVSTSNVEPERGTRSGMEEHRNLHILRLKKEDDIVFQEI